MSGIRQSSVFGSNHVTQTSEGGMLGGILALGAAAAMVAFAIVVGGLVGGAIAGAITILAWVLGGCTVATVTTRLAIHVVNYRRTGQLPPTRPLLTINRPIAYEQIAPAPPVEHMPRMRVTRADYPEDWS